MINYLPGINKLFAKFKSSGIFQYYVTGTGDGGKEILLLRSLKHKGYIRRNDPGMNNDWIVLK